MNVMLFQISNNIEMNQYFNKALTDPCDMLFYLKSPSFLHRWELHLQYNSQICLTTDLSNFRIIPQLNSATVSHCDFAVTLSELSNPLIHNGLLWWQHWHHYPKLEASFFTRAPLLIYVSG